MYPIVKRLFDILFATTALVITAPAVILIALAILISDGPPLLFRGKRMGRGGQVFGMYKFRTMRVGAELAGPGVTGTGDARVTRVGRFLRKWKLDELPQLMNVLRGEMSVVGPRPEDPRYLRWFSEKHRRVLDVRPGITGITQITYRDEEQLLTGANVEFQYRTEVLPSKLDLDLKYVHNASLTTDMKIIVFTFQDVLLGSRVRQNIL